MNRFMQQRSEHLFFKRTRIPLVPILQRGQQAAATPVEYLARHCPGVDLYSQYAPSHERNNR